ncbi:MAG: GNAT family N-acetyltransferase [Flavobacteriales bacterium]
MNNIVPKHLKVRGFRAFDEPFLCEKYLKGHIKVLTDYNITNITSNNNLWMKNPNIYCLIVEENETNEMVGGIRIQLADGILPLPVEVAVGHMDKRIYDMVNQYAINGGIGELSGLWIDNRLRGLGVGVYMVRAAIASSSQLNFKTMTGICGDVTLKMFNDVGFVIDNTIGDNGHFHYPNEELIAHLVGILNAITLENAAEYDKKIMISLRNNTVQQRIEKDTRKEVIIDYNLNYPNIVELNYVSQK